MNLGNYQVVISLRELVILSAQTCSNHSYHGRAHGLQRDMLIPSQAQVISNAGHDEMIVRAQNGW